MRSMTIVDGNGRRADRDEYPVIAVREAILNALIHRDYGSYADRVPISIRMYRDRLEIASRGGVYGGGTTKMLGADRPGSRNETLISMLEMLKIAENRYSGIPTMQKAMESYDLPEPEFKVLRGDFIVTLRSGVCSPQNWSQTPGEDVKAIEMKQTAEGHAKAAEIAEIQEDHSEASELIEPNGGQIREKGETGIDIQSAVVRFCSVPRTRDEIATFTGLSRAYVAKGIVLPLVAEKRLRLTMPEKPKSPFQKYVSPDGR
ncbi:MAG: hypothetical protein IJ523_09280 [Succinivibrionaceae bacterium]|nr:hypothetical protein [Succinivibrionaceae bacterium]